MGILNNSNAISVDSGYDITDSLRFRSSASAYLNRTPASDGNRKTFTVSMWVKRGTLGVEQKLITAHGGNDNNGYFELKFNSSDQLYFGVYTTGSTSAAVFRDPSSWYHVVLKVDTTQASSANRVKVYVNNTDHTVDVGSTLAQNTDLAWNRNVAHSIGRDTRDTNKYIDGYITEVHNVDGTALAPSDFGESDSNGTWIPKKYTGTYGTNGFYLPMKPTTQATGFNTVLYTGNNSSATSQAITGVGFAPDFVWIKNRDTVGQDNNVQDTVNGALKLLIPNETNAQATNSGFMQSFDTDGFTVGSDNVANKNGDNLVAWCWDAGGSTVTNTEGTLSAQVRANPASGFSIITCTGSSGTPTIGHGLDTAPKLLIRKTLNISDNWGVYSEPVGNDKIMSINTDGAAATNDVFGDTTPTADVFTMKPGTNDWVIYAFADVTGYQKIGSYTGNGSTSGPTVTTGFRPAFVMTKRTNGGGGWNVSDNTRSVNNPRLNNLEWNTSNAESTSTAYSISFTDTGFELNDTDDARNGNGDSYIYLAIKDTRDEKFNFDASGNKNNWTPNNINSNASGESTYDLMSDVPTLTDEDTSNFATLNPNNAGTNSDVTFGNLKIANASSHSTIYPTNMPTTGKYYFECKMAVHAAAGGLGFRTDTNKAESAYAEEANKYFLYLNNSSAYIVSETSNVNIGSNLNSGTATFQVAIDFDASEYYFGVNNTWYAADAGTDGNPATGANPTYNLTDGTKMFPFLHTGGLTWTVNFGQQPFAYTPPTGFKKINTYNLPDSTIEDSSEHFANKLYTGNASTQSITGLDFSPDLTWIKVRNSASYEHMWFDSVRGVTKYIRSNTTAGEGTVASTLTSFDSNGFSLGNNNDVNGSSFPIVSWSWRGSDSTAASNDDGSITSTVSANPTAGFSIITYTGNGLSGQSIGHGLNAKPELVFKKNRSQSTNWAVTTTILDGSNDYAHLNLTNAFGNSAEGSPTASVIPVYPNAENNSSGDNFVCYAFHSIEGYSKFDKYTGNGSTDGPFVYTGFRPSFIIFKRTDSTDGGEWKIMDSARTPYNWTCNILFPDSSSAENTSELESTYGIDLLANGFKIRSSHGSFNASGGTYMYMAFAENPFKNSNAR